MEFWNSAVDMMKMLVTAYGAYLAVQGGIGLAEGFSQENPAQKASGGKMLIAGGGVILVGMVMVPKLKDMITTATPGGTPSSSAFATYMYCRAYVPHFPEIPFFAA